MMRRTTVCGVVLGFLALGVMAAAQAAAADVSIIGK